MIMNDELLLWVAVTKSGGSVEKNNEQGDGSARWDKKHGKFYK